MTRGWRRVVTVIWLIADALIPIPFTLALVLLSFVWSRARRWLLAWSQEVFS